MDREELDKLINEVKIEIEKAGWEENTIKFSDIPVKPASEIEIYSMFSKDIFDKEYSFLKNNWEVKQNYPIISCGKLKRVARQVLRKMRKVLLSDYMTKQNAINYCNKQCMRQMQLYIEQMQQEKETLEKKYEILDKKICKLISESEKNREQQ